VQLSILDDWGLDDKFAGYPFTCRESREKPKSGLFLVFIPVAATGIRFA
jgi:hypothetical protein